MRRAIATVSLSGTLEEKLEAAAHAGFDGVELFENDLIGSPLAPHEVRALIRGLSAQQRDVILLRVIGDFSVAETARILDKSEGAVRVTQTRALQALRDGLMALPDSKADDDES